MGMEKLEPCLGTVKTTKGINICHYHQHFEELLPLDKDPVEYLTGKFNLTPFDARGKLGQFNLPGASHYTKIGNLSGGQKARVAFANLMLEKPHILILDEPTNHLDIESVVALTTAIKNFDGGIVVVTHDARLISAIDCAIWVVEDGGLYQFDGDFEGYRQKVLDDLERRQEEVELRERRRREERDKQRQEAKIKAEEKTRLAQAKLRAKQEEEDQAKHLLVKQEGEGLTEQLQAKPDEEEQTKQLASGPEEQGVPEDTTEENSPETGGPRHEEEQAARLEVGQEEQDTAEPDKTENLISDAYHEQEAADEPKYTTDKEKPNKEITKVMVKSEKKTSRDQSGSEEEDDADVDENESVEDVDATHDEYKVGEIIVLRSMKKKQGFFLC